MADMPEELKTLKALDATVTRLGHITALLEWDQETYMPVGGGGERAAQIALMSGLHHEKIVDSAWEQAFGALDESGSGGLGEADEAFLREARKRWEKKVKVPGSLVEELARETSLAQSAWVNARKNNDFASFAPYLSKVIDLEKRYAGYINPDSDTYDVLLDEYEPGATAGDIADIFDGLADGLKSLLERIETGSRPISDFLEKPYPEEKQDLFGRKVQAWMGYDRNRGRLDLSAHPFTTTLSPDDVRVTTRYNENLVLSGLFSNIHEAGHGLYEQGFGKNLRGSLLADGTSLGIHESQSRFWENTLGRSLAFWEHWYPEFQALFPGNLAGVSVENFYKAVNLVQPSLIRVEADEVTYSFHVIIRFRLERALIAGDLKVSDLPEAWNAAYSELLGIEVPDDSSGCLQDVHWSAGLFGYFPTYALGNLYAAQFSRQMENDLGALEGLMENKGAAAILDWLRKNIHVHGRIYPPGELCRRVTGSDLDPAHFLSYLESKYSEVYGF